MSEEQPPPLTVKLSPEEEKAALLGCMGSIYGEAKKIDSGVVGASSTLSNNSSERIKAHVEELVNKNAPVDSVPAPTTPQPQPVPQPQPQVQPEPVNDSQLTFNFDINEKDVLFDKISKLTARVDSLHHKIDKVFEIVNTKRSTKKKSLENRQTS